MPLVISNVVLVCSNKERSTCSPALAPSRRRNPTAVYRPSRSSVGSWIGPYTVLIDENPHYGEFAQDSIDLYYPLCPSLPMCDLGDCPRFGSSPTFQTAGGPTTPKHPRQTQQSPPTTRKLPSHIPAPSIRVTQDPAHGLKSSHAQVRQWNTQYSCPAEIGPCGNKMHGRAPQDRTREFSLAGSSAR